ncbi:MAG: hypothetical protein SPH93_04450 [Clostridium sp.]|nr:hypothetical protein [Clostridium sp.]MDY6226919.1 hypothetical protein [Clostridium sp.]
MTFKSFVIKSRLINADRNTIDNYNSYYMQTMIRIYKNILILDIS